MRNCIKTIIKTKHPRIFRACKGIRSAFYKVIADICYPIEILRFRFCLFFGYPYFGPIMCAGQTAPARKKYMRAALQQCTKSSPIRVLEIGSWAGGSTCLWADKMRELGIAGSVTCVDPWLPYLASQGHQPHVEMETALKEDRIFKLFLHNVDAAGHSGIIRAIRESSKTALPKLKSNTFDLIFVDGAHTYSGVIADLKNCERLLTIGGIMCGDDLEKQLPETDIGFTRKSQELEFTIDKKTDDSYHPGVTAAVHDFFGGQVSVFSGFWAMRKTESGWGKFILSKRLE